MGSQGVRQPAYRITFRFRFHISPQVQPRCFFHGALSHAPDNCPADLGVFDQQHRLARGGDNRDNPGSEACDRSPNPLRDPLQQMARADRVCAAIRAENVIRFQPEPSIANQVVGMLARGSGPLSMDVLSGMTEVEISTMAPNSRVPFTWFVGV